MKLTQEPETVTWPEMHYVFVEEIGPFQTSAPADLAATAQSYGCNCRTQ